MEAFYPPSAFYFKVEIDGEQSIDTSFSEVSGIKSEMEMDTPYREGGENGFVYQLPKGIKHGNLVLKRGVGPKDSPLVKWCIAVFEGGLGEPITPCQVGVKLLDEEGQPLRHWTFEDAFPVKWEIDGFKSTKNEVAIETIELSYTTLTRSL
jgi:phage tail-like protein